MPALSGQVISTLYDPATNAVAIQVTWFYVPASRVLRDNPAAWTDGNGRVWAAGSGAFIGVNATNRQVSAIIVNATGQTVRKVTLPANTGRALTAVQLSQVAPPDGPFTTADDLNSLTFNFAG